MWSREGPAIAYQTVSEVTVAYDPATGETHFLSDLPAMVLEIVSTSPSTEHEILRALSAPLDPSQELLDRLQSALKQLKQAGLIDWVDPVPDFRA
jgi:PqqD family protein of HPr-rel-A system